MMMRACTFLLFVFLVAGLIGCQRSAPEDAGGGDSTPAKTTATDDGSNRIELLADSDEEESTEYEEKIVAEREAIVTKPTYDPEPADPPASPPAEPGSAAGPGLAGRASAERSDLLRAYGGSVAAEPDSSLPPGASPEEGIGPGEGGDKFDHVVENPFRRVADDPLSTFSIDVDTASYSKTRMFLLEHGRMPPADAVRIEEMVNYFTYDYSPPADEHPFAAQIEVAQCPWNGDHRLVRVGVKGRVIEQAARPSSNLVFLLDVSGSMSRPNKLPLVKEGMKMLVDQLGENDRVAIVVYAGAAGLVLPSTTADQKQTIVAALDKLHAGGSTNGGEGIRLAYATAREHFIQGGTNRVILCSDGDFNVGTTSTGELVRLAEENAKQGVFVSVLGFGTGNHNDAMLEQISNKANGNYAFIDTRSEAKKVLVEQLSGTLVTIAKDVKIQVEFNPAKVGAYRLIGYENRILAARDFNDDKKDAGEIGAGHTVTALYETIPPGEAADAATTGVDPLKYQKPAEPNEAAEPAGSDEMLTVKMRYKLPDADTSTKVEFPVVDSDRHFAEATPDFQFAGAVAAFGMLLRGSEHAGNATFDAVLELAQPAVADDPHGYRTEFVEIVRRAKEIAGG